MQNKQTVSQTPRNSAVSRNFVHPNSKSPVTVIFIFHACTLRACSDLQVESYGVAGPLVETLCIHVAAAYPVDRTVRLRAAMVITAHTNFSK